MKCGGGGILPSTQPFPTFLPPRHPPHLNLSLTFQLVTPGSRFSAVISPLTSTSSMAPPHSSSSSETTASSSIGLNVHVEYTMRPPT